jgi:hypothetical protein
MTAGAPWAWRAGALAALGVLAACGCGPKPQRPSLRWIVIRGFAFEPDTVDARAGDTLVWTNQDILPHTTTAADTSWDSDSLEPGEAWRMVVDESLEPDYFCRFHPTMRGTIRIED